MVEPGDFGADNYNRGPKINVRSEIDMSAEINARFENDDIDVSEFFENDGEDEIIDIIVQKELNRIKVMIGKTLDKKKTDLVDEKFFKSLKKNFVLRGKAFDDNVLKELSYMYFARYNNTMDIYYKLEANKQDIFYFMLDKNLYNNINLTDDLDFEKFDIRSKRLLQTAYENGVCNDVLDILKINPNFVWKGYSLESQRDKLKKENFQQILKCFSKKFIANCSQAAIDTIYEAIEIGEFDYLKTIVNINPNVDVSYLNFNEQVRKAFTDEEMAFLNSEHHRTLKYLINRSGLYPLNFKTDEEKSANQLKLLDYYIKIIRINSSFRLHFSRLIFYITYDDDLYIAPEILATFDADLQKMLNNMYEIYYDKKIRDEDIKDKIEVIRLKNKIKHLIRKETKKFNSMQQSNRVETTIDKPKQYLKK